MGAPTPSQMVFHKSTCTAANMPSSHAGGGGSGRAQASSNRMTMVAIVPHARYWAGMERKHRAYLHSAIYEPSFSSCIRGWMPWQKNTAGSVWLPLDRNMINITTQAKRECTNDQT